MLLHFPVFFTALFAVVAATTLNTVPLVHVSQRGLLVDHHRDPPHPTNTHHNVQRHSNVYAYDDLDLSLVAWRLMNKPPKWSAEHTEVAVKEYRRFLYMAAMHTRNTSLVPSADVDEVWHAHILYTRAYVRDCKRVAGHYIHHQPALPPGNDVNENRAMREQMRANYGSTLTLYEKVFGVPAPSNIWPRMNTGDCQDCETCSAQDCKFQDSCNCNKCQRDAGENCEQSCACEKHCTTCGTCQTVFTNGGAPGSI